MPPMSQADEADEMCSVPKGLVLRRSVPEGGLEAPQAILWKEEMKKMRRIFAFPHSRYVT
jgi:hypothetical protein